MGSSDNHHQEHAERPTVQERPLALEGKLMKTTHRLLFAAALFAAPLLAQTRIDIAQLKGPGSTIFRLMAGKDSKAVWVEIGDGISVVQDGQMIRISVIPSPPPPPAAVRPPDVFTPAVSTTTFQASDSVWRGVYKNGMLQAPFLDYTFVGKAITFVVTPGAGDVIQITY